MNFNHYKNQGLSRKTGSPINLFLFSFSDSFQKSGENLLKSYLSDFNEYTKWMLLSDYALYDKKKKNDVITFSLIPYLASFTEITKIIEKLAPTDIKKTKFINSEFIKFLANGPIFSISIKLNRNRRLCSDERGYFQEKIDMIISQHEYWIENSQEEEKKRFEQNIKLFKRLKSILTRKGVNLKIARDIEIVSTLVAYFMYKVEALTNVEIISWLSDRDALLNFKSKELGCIIFELTNIYHNALCKSQQIDPISKIAFGVPVSDQENSDKPWYDVLIRIPDLIAGTLADYDYEENRVTHNKFCPIIENLIATERRNLFYEINFSEQNKVRRICFLPKK